MNAEGKEPYEHEVEERTTEGMKLLGCKRPGAGESKAGRGKEAMRGVHTEQAILGSDIEDISCNGFYFVGEIGDKIIC